MIFVHDHPFIRSKDAYYTSGSLNNILFQRYIDLFGEVSVFATVRPARRNDDGLVNEHSKVTNVRLSLVEKRNNLFHIFKSRHKLKTLISEHDCVIVRMPSIYSIFATRYARMFEKPYLIELVGCPWDALWNHGWKGKMFAPVMWFATRLMVKRASYVVYVTDDFLQQRYPCDGEVIGCSDVALLSFDETVLQRRLQKISRLKRNDPIRLGTVGSYSVRYKGQQDVIKAISLLNRKGYNFEYHLVGSGDNSYLASVAKRHGVEDRVIFAGPLPHEKVFQFLDDIDIYVQPSRHEGLPRALIEALSRGCPAIGAKVGGIAELLSFEFLFPKRSVSALCRLLVHTSKKETMMHAATRNFNKAKDYDSRLLNDKRKEFYEKFMSDNRLVKRL